MEAKMHLHGEITVVTLSGKIEIEKNQKFKEVCLQNLTNRKVIFQMNDLCFVGSTGIQAFFQAVNEVSQQNPFGVRVTGLKDDFARLFHFGNHAGLVLHENLDSAVKSF